MQDAAPRAPLPHSETCKARERARTRCALRLTCACSGSSSTTMNRPYVRRKLGMKLGKLRDIDRAHQRRATDMNGPRGGVDQALQHQGGAQRAARAWWSNAGTWRCTTPSTTRYGRRSRRFGKCSSQAHEAGFAEATNHRRHLDMADHQFENPCAPLTCRSSRGTPFVTRWRWQNGRRKSRSLHVTVPRSRYADHRYAGKRRPPPASATRGGR